MPTFYVVIAAIGDGKIRTSWETGKETAHEFARDCVRKYGGFASVIECVGCTDYAKAGNGRIVSEYTTTL